MMTGGKFSTQDVICGLQLVKSQAGGRPRLGGNDAREGSPGIWIAKTPASYYASTIPSPSRALRYASNPFRHTRNEGANVVDIIAVTMMYDANCRELLRLRG